MFIDFGFDRVVFNILCSRRPFSNMEGVRMLAVIVEQDSRKLGGNALLIPFQDSWSTNNTCRQLLVFVFNGTLQLPDVLAAASEMKVFCMQQDEITKVTTSGSGRKTRVNKDLGSATVGLACTFTFIIESFSAYSFRFKLISAETPDSINNRKGGESEPILHDDAFADQLHFLPPLLARERMYADH